jgi:hypothetical protein
MSSNTRLGFSRTMIEMQDTLLHAFQDKGDLRAREEVGRAGKEPSARLAPRGRAIPSSCQACRLQMGRAS